MANSYSTSDVLKGALGYGGEKTDGTSPYHALTLKFIDDLYKSLLSGPTEFAPEIRCLWSWAKVQGTFSIPTYFSTGTVTTVNGNTTITFSSAPTISLTGYSFKADNYDSWYTISSHTASSTTATLDGAWVDTGASGLAFKAIPLVKDLGSGICVIGDALRIYVNRALEYGEKATDAGKIYIMSSQEFWQKYPLRLIKNDVPTRFTVETQSQSSYKLRFNKYVTNSIKVDYDKINIPDSLIDTTTSIPLIPFTYREILEAGGAFKLLMHKKQPTEAQTHFTRTQLLIQAMHNAEQKIYKSGSKNFGKLIPRLDDIEMPFNLVDR